MATSGQRTSFPSAWRIALSSDSRTSPQRRRRYGTRNHELPRSVQPTNAHRQSEKSLLSSRIPLIFSIDTEEDNWIPTRKDITVENIHELPALQRTLERVGIKPTYFTTYQVALDKRARAVISDLAAAGAEVGAHLHPWNTPPIEEDLEPRNTMLCNLPAKLQIDKLRYLTNYLEQSFGSRPTVFRAGRWALGLETVAALLSCGYNVDSSITPLKSWAMSGGQNFEDAPLVPHWVEGEGRQDRIREVPVSWGYSRRPFRLWHPLHRALSESVARRLGLASLAVRSGFLRKIGLSPEIQSSDEMFTLARNLVTEGIPFLHVFMHSPSLRPGLTPFVDSKQDVTRLHRTIEAFVQKLERIVTIVPATLSEATQMLEGQGVESYRLKRPPAKGPAVPTPQKRPGTTTSSSGRAVVVSYHYPTDGAVGGLRWAGLCKYLARIGWSSRIIVAAPPPTSGESPSVVIESHPRRSTLRDVYRAIRKRAARTETAADEATRAPNSPSLVTRLRLAAATALAWPDDGRGWILVAAAATHRAIKHDRPDVVVSSGPPHSVHLAAWLATRGQSCRWLVDVRDPWAGPYSDGWRSHPPSTLRSAIVARLERMVFHRCDGVICNTQALARALRVRYPEVEIHCVPNAVDVEALPKKPPVPRYRLEIVHVGTIYGARSLEPVLRGFKRFLDRHPDATPQACRVTVAGLIEGGYEEVLPAQISALALEEFVSILGAVRRVEALELTARAQVVVVLAQEQLYQVPAKLYEAVALANRTLVVAEPGTAAWEEGQRVGAITVSPDDTHSIENLVSQVWQGPALEPSRDAAKNVSYSEAAPRVAALFARDES